MKPSILTFVVTMACVLVEVDARADVPDLLPIQGVLTDASGNFVNGSTDVVFAIYDAEVAKKPIYVESRTGGDAVYVEEGFFTVYLGELAPLDTGLLLSSPELWIGITVGVDEEMNRSRLATSLFALQAKTCQAVGSLSETDINDNFLPSSWVPGWSDLTGIPLGFSDNVDNGFTTEGDLTSLLNDNYAASGHNHNSAYAALVHNHSSTYAPITHSHSYLPLSGGTLTGSVTTSGSITQTGTTADMTVADNLNVGDIVSADAYNFNAPKTGYVTFGATSFAGTSTSRSTNGYIYGSGIHYYTPVFPDGVTLTNMRCYGYANSAGSEEFYFLLRYRPVASLIMSNLVYDYSGSLSNSTAIRVFDTAMTHTVNNSAYQYVLYTNITTSDPNHRFYGCRITYTSTAAAY